MVTLNNHGKHLGSVLKACNYQCFVDRNWGHKMKMHIYLEVLNDK